MRRVEGPVNSKLSSITLICVLADLGKLVAVKGQVKDANVLDSDLRQGPRLDWAAVCDLSGWELAELVAQFLDEIVLGLGRVSGLLGSQLTAMAGVR